MRLDEYVEYDPAPHEQIRLVGTGIGIEHIVRYHKGGMTPEQISHSFAYPIPLEQIYGVIAYYLHNRSEIDSYLARIESVGELLRKKVEAMPGNRTMRDRLKAAIANRAQTA